MQLQPVKFINTDGVKRFEKINTVLVMDESGSRRHFEALLLTLTHHAHDSMTTYTFTFNYNVFNGLSDVHGLQTKRKMNWVESSFLVASNSSKMAYDLIQ